MRGPGNDLAEFWRPAAPGAGSLAGVQLLKASFVEYEYARHTHPEYAIGVIETGVQAFWCRGSQRFAPAGSTVMLPPGEVHDGMPAIDSGYRYRMIYVEPQLVCSVREQIQQGQSSLPPPDITNFASPVVQDPELAATLVQLHRDLEPQNLETACPLAVETRLLAALTRLLREHADADVPSSPVRVEARRARQAMEFMQAHLGEKISLRQLSEHLAISPYHFVRSFRRQVGLPPHACLTQLRLDEARRLIRADVPLAEVALRVGFASQSHLNNRFKAAYGYTPGAYRRAVATRTSTHKSTHKSTHSTRIRGSRHRP